MQAPIATVSRTPMRSASQPMKMPPAPVPTQVSAPASATTERSVPSASWIGFMPTTISSGVAKENDRIARTNQAVHHEALLSTLAGRVAPPPGSGPSILFPHCELACSSAGIIATKTRYWNAIGFRYAQHLLDLIHEDQAPRPYRHLRLRTLLRHHVLRRRRRRSHLGCDVQE